MGAQKNPLNEIVLLSTQSKMFKLADKKVFIILHSNFVYMYLEGAQWLSGRVLDSRPKGSGFEPHRRHCVVVLEQDTFILA